MPTMKEQQPSAPPEEPGNAQNTRERLLRAAIEIFGEAGFDAATTRQIATRAGVNLAAIPYYFGTKEELFTECISTVLSFARERFLQMREEIEQKLLRPGIRKPEIRQMLETFLLAMLEIIASDEVRPYAPLVLREHIMPGRAFDILYEKFFCPQHKLATRLVALLMNLPPESPESILRTHAIFGNIFGFFSGRNLLLRRLGRTTDKQERLRPEEVELVRVIIAENIRAIFADAVQPADRPCPTSKEEQR